MEGGGQAQKNNAAAKMGNVQPRIRQSCRIVKVAAQLRSHESLAGPMAARINRYR